MEITSSTRLLGNPFTLPCGVTLKNRLLKSAMSDSLGDGAGNPTHAQMRLYERWAKGGAALTLIGEAQVGPHYPEKPGNLVLAPGVNVAALTELARRGSQNGAQIWPQLGHAGALAHGPISVPKGPSPLNVDGLTCAGLTEDEIRALPQTFAQAASIARSAGFGGVQIHAGHGFLFSQFLSPLFNRRSDAYGGPVSHRFRVIGETIDAVRKAVGPAFPIGIRINSTDMLAGGLTSEDALDVVRLIDRTSIDLIDISGGTYFPGATSSSDGVSASGPDFIGFSKRAKGVTGIPIALTSGFRTRDQVEKALQDEATDAISLGRALALDPSLPNTWLSDKGGDPVFPRFKNPPPGGVTAWYSMRLTALGKDKDAHFTSSPAEALDMYNRRDAARCEIWRNRFARGDG